MKEDTRSRRYIAPSYLASYLVSGEPGDLTPQEIANADAWIDRLGFGPAVDVEEDGYRDIVPQEWYDIDPLAKAGDYSVYSFLSL